MECYFSTGSFIERNLAEILSISIGQGFDIELSSSITCSSEEVNAIGNVAGQVKFLIHNYFPPPPEPFVLNLASNDPTIHKKSVELCFRAIDLCHNIGAPFYSVHAGFAFHLTPGILGDPVAQSCLAARTTISRDKAYKKFVETVKMVANYAGEKNIQLLVENNVVTQEILKESEPSPLLLSEVEEILRFFSDVNDPSIGLLLDTGHAKVSSKAHKDKPERYFEVLSPHVRALHLSDNDGERDTHQQFDENAWFAPFLRDFARLPMVIEARRLSLREMADQQQLLTAMLV